MHHVIKVDIVAIVDDAPLCHCECMSEPFVLDRFDLRYVKTFVLLEQVRCSNGGNFASDVT